MKNNQKTNENQSKQFYYPVRDAQDPRKVSLEPIPEHLYHQLMPEIWKVRKRMQRSGQCTCPQSRLWACDADCLICPYRAAGREVSLSTPLDDAEDLTLEDTISNDNPTPESIAMDRALLDALHAELEALDPEGKRICELLMKHSEREAAAEMGLSRSSFKRRWAKVKTGLADRLKDYYE